MSLRTKISCSLATCLAQNGHFCRVAALLSSVLLAAPAGQAQQLPALVVSSAQPTYRNALRFDVGGIFITNLTYNLLNSNPETLVPVLVSYERQLKPRFSVVAEGLLNGGTPDERKTGLGVQGRYYVVQAQDKAPLSGLYVAPALSYRAVGLSGYRQPDTRQHFAGAGALLGWQVVIPRSPRLFLDASLGVMSWLKLGKNKVQGEVPPGYYEPDSYFERTPTTIDGRLGIGFKF
ncbi:hypothetical protein [Hymenobacter metallicola]|uniref:DUF3575 domain-containing protein n=1 Tax=Hymenobacter metallicola TaxID=2563114 RepID=A0A4Z0Q8L4_9BACT|nr:hypothetical protein [Hymenobacter metallicola]TGE26427.1 hypothetical protein E5K02_16670 [Hymenobacter metallicola]